MHVYRLDEPIDDFEGLTPPSRTRRPARTRGRGGSSPGHPHRCGLTKATEPVSG